MRRSERWRHMKNDLGKSEKEIIASFDKPTQMEIFAWEKGKYSEIDTVMKPMDSMRYYKSFLRPAMMSMDPQTGHVKAWVGGMNYKHFKYDMVKQGKRQVVLPSSLLYMQQLLTNYNYRHVIPYLGHQ